jgi:hypothetical protein
MLLARSNDDATMSHLLLLLLLLVLPSCLQV